VAHWSPTPSDGGVAQALETRYVCYHTKLHRSTSNCFGISRQTSKSFGFTGPRPMGLGRGKPPRNTLLPHVQRTKFRRCRSTFRRRYGSKNWGLRGPAPMEWGVADRQKHVIIVSWLHHPRLLIAIHQPGGKQRAYSVANVFSGSVAT